VQLSAQEGTPGLKAWSDLREQIAFQKRW